MYIIYILIIMVVKTEITKCLHVDINLFFAIIVHQWAFLDYHL
jgi:hypothetical protein